MTGCKARLQSMTQDRSKSRGGTKRMLHARLGGRGSHLAISSCGDGVELSLGLNLRIPCCQAAFLEIELGHVLNKDGKSVGRIRARCNAARTAPGATGGG